MTADEFMESHKVTKRTSKIEPFMEEVLKLRRNGMSYSAILKFLSLNGVDVTMATFSVYMRRHAPPELVPPAKTQPQKTNPKSAETVSTPLSPQPVESPESPGSSGSKPLFAKKKQKPEVTLDFMNEE